MRLRAWMSVAALTGGLVAAGPVGAEPGSGALFSRQALPTTIEPRTALLADTNGDGRDDLVTAVGVSAGTTASRATRGVSVMLARSGGGFAPAVRYGSNELVVSDVSVVDASGDGAVDIVAALGEHDEPHQSVAVWHGAGDGTFAGPFVAFATPFHALAVGRFRGPGLPEAALAGEQGLRIAANRGAFDVRGAVPVDDVVYEHLAAADVDGDGRDELAAATRDGTIALFRGTTRSAATVLGAGVVDLTAAEFDGRPGDEFVVTAGDGAVLALDGDLAVLDTMSGSAQGVAATAGDWDGDGAADLVRVNATPTLTVAATRLGREVTVPLARPASDILVADATGDGHPDLLAVEPTSHVVEVVEGDGTGAFPPERPLTPTPVGGGDVVVADLNGDEVPDVLNAECGAWAQTLLDTMDIGSYLGDGKGGFSGKSSVQAPGTACYIASGDVNGDRRADLVMADYYTGGVHQWLGNGDGTFGIRTSMSGCHLADGIGVRDLNRDGYADAAVVCRAVNTPASVTILAGSPVGLVRTPVLLPYQVNAETYRLRFGDINGDRNTDIVVASHNNHLCVVYCQSEEPDVFATGRSVTYFLGNGNLTFAPARSYLPGEPFFDIAVGDLDGDTRDDILATFVFEDALHVRYGKADGTLTPAVLVPSYEYPIRAVIADVTGDGRSDVVLAHGPNAVSVTPGATDGFGVPAAYISQDVHWSPSVGDFDRDGRSDVLVAEQGKVEVFLNGA